MPDRTPLFSWLVDPANHPLTPLVRLPLAALLTLIPRSASATDPCDFTSAGSSTFSYAQVTACYREVPYAEEDLDNSVAVIREHRERSDLAEIYQERAGWKESLEALLAAGHSGEYLDDFSMHEALKREHKAFRNAHVAYTPPPCYWRMLNAFVPFDFGSATLRRKGMAQQIIFVEAARFLPDVYRQATGIDAERYVGMRVLQINGVPVLDYFRDFGRSFMNTHEDDGGHLNGILNQASYSVRLGGAHDFLPSRPSDDYLLETAEGRTVRVTLPWAFVAADILLGEFAVPLSSSQSEFVSACTAPFELPGGAIGLELLAHTGPEGGELDSYRHRALRECSRRYPARGQQGRPIGYYEVPPEQLGQGIQEIIPQTGSARVLQFGDRVTVLRLRNTVGWVDVARRGIDYACQRSERLILDLRGNNGGNDTVIQWLYHHLFPEAEVPSEAGKLISRLRNDRPELNEFLFASALWDAVLAPNDPPCGLGLGPGCPVDVETGDTLPRDDWDWFLSPYVEEQRGGQTVTLSRELGLPYVDRPLFDSARCAGRFSGKDLVLLTDGSNASGGYFLPASFKGQGVIVKMGGYLGESLAMGRARGGATFAASTVGAAKQLMEQYSGGLITFQHQPLLFRRQVESQMEALGVYLKDRSALHIEQPVDADLYLDVWSDSPETDGFVYGKVLEVVDRSRESR